MDALEMAMKMETDAISFYTEAARKTVHPIGKKMFMAITDDEKQHLAMISQILKGLDITPADVTPLKKVKTIFEAMKGDMMRKAEATHDELEAFKMAMKMEKEGVAFYQETLSASKKEKERRLLERLIEEERQHYSIFANTCQFLENTGSWFLWEERGILEGG